MVWNCNQKWTVKELHEGPLTLKWLHRKLIMSPSPLSEQNPLWFPQHIWTGNYAAGVPGKVSSRFMPFIEHKHLDLYIDLDLYITFIHIFTAFFLFWQNWMNLRLQWAEKSQWASHDQVQFTFLSCRVQLRASSRKNKHLMASWLLCDF